MIPPLLGRWVGRPGRSPRPMRRRPELEPLEGRIALSVLTLGNGPGEGTATGGVDGYGSFGSAIGSVFYRPAGGAPASYLAFQSSVAICFRDGAETPAPCAFLSTTDIGGSGALPDLDVTGTSTQAVSKFTYQGLNVRLDQLLLPLASGAGQVGSVLVQTYQISNKTSQQLAFSLFRYFHADLLFGGPASANGGGRFVRDGMEILVEAPTTAVPPLAASLVGIAAEGGAIPPTGRFEVGPFPELRDRILRGAGLRDLVAGDGPDADQFIDPGQGYVVTQALRNDFALAPGQTAIYVTTTFFGIEPPATVPPDNRPPADGNPPPADQPPPDHQPPPAVPPVEQELPPTGGTPIPPPAALLPAVLPPVVSPTTQLGIALVQGRAGQPPAPEVVPALLSAARPLPTTDAEALRPIRNVLYPETSRPSGSERVPAGEGSITGRVFEDDNGNGVPDPGERGLAGQTVYLDLNGDGMYQPGEPTAVTDSQGEYVFTGLPLDTYVVRQVIWERLEQTYPAMTPVSTSGERGAHVVTLTKDNPRAGAKNFGVVILRVPRPRRPGVRPPPDDKSPSPPAPPPPPEEQETALDRFFEQFPACDEADGMDAGPTAPGRPLLLSAVALLYWLQPVERKRSPAARRIEAGLWSIRR